MATYISLDRHTLPSPRRRLQGMVEASGEAQRLKGAWENDLRTVRSQENVLLGLGQFLATHDKHVYKQW